LKKKWGKPHRQLAIFDLSLGLVIPFVLATGCVVIAAASQFHAKSSDVFEEVKAGGGKSAGDYFKAVDARISLDKEMSDKLQVLKESGDADALAAFRNELPEADRQVAAMVAARGNLRLADTLAPLTGKSVAQKVFGIGVVGMAISTIIILMVINGFAVCEMFGKEAQGNLFRFGCLLPGIVGVFGPFVWSGAAAALATPTSVLGGAMLPIAYFGFFLLMNSKAVLGDSRPKGTSRLIWNVLMIFATVVATFASIWGMWSKAYNEIPMGKIGVGILVVLFIVGTIGFLANEKRAAQK
ncbi:MAG: divalent metal cation transporter, partial [Verrucomicrobiota bacterium]